MQPSTPLKRARTVGSAATIGVLLIVSTVVWAQGAGKGAPAAAAQKPQAGGPPPGSTLHFKTQLGSFKLLPKDPKVMPSGMLKMTFKGSVLISGLDGNGTLTPSGSIRREYYDKTHNKQVWYGTGGMVIQGRMKNVEWFGDNLDAVFVGDAYFRLYGEFAKDKTTGDYWFDDGEKWPWLPSGSGVPVPQEKLPVPGYDQPVGGGTGPKKGGG